MSNKIIESLIEETVTKDSATGLTRFDESKLRKTLNQNKRLGGRNKDIFAAEEPKYNTCKLYDPCPLCDKCRNKGSHLYNKCGTCQIPICVHTHADRKKLLRRQNFEIKGSPLANVLKQYV